MDDLPSEHGVGLPDSALLGHLHVRPKQQAVHGAGDAEVIRLKTHTTQLLHEVLAHFIHQIIRYLSVSVIIHLRFIFILLYVNAKLYMCMFCPIIF